MKKSIEFLIVRHPRTQVDREFMKNEQGVWEPCSDEQIVKGASEKYEYRLSDRGILEADETALKLHEYYLKHGKTNLMLLHSSLNRTTEFDEILRQVLKEGSLYGEVIHKPVDEFRERWFGDIDGQPKKEVEGAVEATRIFPDIEHALTYADDFKFLAEYLGIPDPKPGESFLDTFYRFDRGVQKYILGECFDEDGVPQFDYVPIPCHQIGGVFLLGSLMLITKPREEIEAIIRLRKKETDPMKIQAYKECLVPYYLLEPSMFNRIKFTYFNDRLWFTGIEQNDHYHLSELEKRIIDPETGQVRIEDEDAKRVLRVRNSLSRWYAQRGWPIDPDKKVLPFETYDSVGTRGPSIGSPLELWQIIIDSEKLADPYIDNHMGTGLNISHFPNWIENTFGYADLGEQIEDKLRQLTVTTPADIPRIRREIHKILKDYISLQN